MQINEYMIEHFFIESNYFHRQLIHKDYSYSCVFQSLFELLIYLPVV